MTCGKTALAILVFERHIRTYPDSLNAYSSLAEALIAAGDTASARAQLQAAATAAQRMGVAFPAAMQKPLDALAAKQN